MNVGKLWHFNQTIPNLCTGPGTTFPSFRGAVTIGGAAIERWAASAHPDEPHSIFFDPKTCTPASEVGLGGMPPSGITYFDVQKVKPDPKVFTVPSFCPLKTDDDAPLTAAVTTQATRRCS